MSGEKTHWFDMDTICRRAKFLADEVPDKELFVFYDGDYREAYTALELYMLAGRLANRLRQQGFRHQDVIANTLVNSPERVITDLGIIMAGCVTMNGQLLIADGSDFFQALRNSRCRGIIVAVGENSAAWQLMGKYITVSKLPYIGDIGIQQAPEVNTAILVHREKDGSQRKPFIKDLKTCAEEVFENKGVNPEDLAIVCTTSGSTGYSKLVPRSHKEIENYIDLNYTRSQWTHPRDNKRKLYCESQLGPFVFRGYFNRLEDPDPQTQKVFTSDGWYNTNDYGYMDDSGDLFVHGRNNDIINYGHYLLYPSWMENKLMEHPDITMACLVPVSDPVICQDICACLKLVPGSELSKEAIRNYCRSTFLPNVASVMAPIPGFYLLFKDEFPQTPSGKPDKVTLKKMAEDKFGYNGGSKKNTEATA